MLVVPRMREKHQKEVHSFFSPTFFWRHLISYIRYPLSIWQWQNTISQEKQGKKSGRKKWEERRAVRGSQLQQAWDEFSQNWHCNFRLHWMELCQLETYAWGKISSNQGFDLEGQIDWEDTWKTSCLKNLAKPRWGSWEILTLSKIKLSRTHKNRTEESPYKISKRYSRALSKG